MDNTQKIIVKHLLSSHYCDFMFDARHSKHGDQESINNFCEIVKREIKDKENVDVECNNNLLTFIFVCEYFKFLTE